MARPEIHIPTHSPLAVSFFMRYSVINLVLFLPLLPFILTRRNDVYALSYRGWSDSRHVTHVQLHCYSSCDISRPLDFLQHRSFLPSYSSPLFSHIVQTQAIQHRSAHVLVSRNGVSKLKKKDLVAAAAAAACSSRQRLLGRRRHRKQTSFILFQSSFAVGYEEKNLEKERNAY